MDETLGKEGLSYQYKIKVTDKNFSKIDMEELKVIIRDNELLTGIVDKASIGSTAFGLIHCFYELNGSKKTGKLLTALSRLFSAYLQMRGFTCSLIDLVTSETFNKSRNEQLENLHKEGAEAVVKLCGYKDYSLPQTCKLFDRMDLSVPAKKRIKNIIKKQPNTNYITKDSLAAQSVAEKHIMDPEGQALCDGEVKSAIKDFVGKINSEALNEGLLQKFPVNNFSLMTLTGAKGSLVNHSQISSMLGQQELEGARVPIMASGKTLPCFIPYDPNPRAGGFIGDRFLTGLRPQELYFHCMAGREGLIDTAVKTSRSGYLQRILVKNLESLCVQYDYTVRENDGSIIQFLYGEDSLDGTKVNPLER